MITQNNSLKFSELEALRIEGDIKSSSTATKNAEPGPVRVEGDLETGSFKGYNGIVNIPVTIKLINIKVSGSGEICEIIYILTALWYRMRNKASTGC